MSRRILFITDSKKRHSGGIKQLYYNILGLHRRGYKVYLAAPRSAGIIGLVLSMLAGAFEMEFTRPRENGRRLAQYCQDQKLELVHSFHTQGQKAAVWAHWFDPRLRLYVNRGVSFPPKNVFYLYYPGIAGYVCNSAAVGRVFSRRLVPAHKINVVHNAFVGDEARFHTRTSTLELAPGPRICCISNNGRWKGLGVVLKAFDRVRDPAAHLYVIGAEARAEYLATLQPSKRDRVHFLGVLDNVPALLPQMDLFTIAPLAGDSSPNVVLEAFAAGLPVVATRVGGLPELIREHDNGFTVPRKDVAALAGRLDQLLADPALRAEIGARNKDRVLAFGLERKLDSLERVYAGETVREVI